jgi:predicted amidohydrolase YtcJ
VLDAVGLYTVNTASAAFEEREKGSMEVGELANLAIVPEDLTWLVPERRRGALVDMRVAGGEVAYEPRGGHARL